MEAWIESLGLADANYYIEWINDQVLPYSIGNYIQYPVINHNGKEYEKECVSVECSSDFEDLFEKKECKLSTFHVLIIYVEMLFI